jgi:negative regulator of replication initiation
MFNGALNYLTGTAVANRIGLSDLLINSTGYREQDNAILAFMQLMGGPAYGVADRMQQGVKLIMEGETLRGLERMLPAGIANGFKGYRFATEGANTLRGDPIVGEMSTANAFAQFFGFAPAEYTRQLEINANLKNIDRRATEERTKLLRQYYISMRMGDTDGAQDVMTDMLKFNRRFPTAAITAKTIQSSMAQHMKTSQEMYHGITLSKSLRPMLLQNAAEFDGENYEE